MVGVAFEKTPLHPFRASPRNVTAVRPLHLEKAPVPILVTGFPSMVAGMTSSPVAEDLKLVMVTLPSVVE